MRRLNRKAVNVCAGAVAGLSLLIVQVAAAAPECDPSARVACRAQANQKKADCIRAGSAIGVCNRAYTDQLNACMAAAHCPVYVSPLRPQ